MTEITTISLDRLSNGAHFAFHADVLAAIVDNPKVASKIARELQVYQAAFEAEREVTGLSRKNFHTDEVSKADAERSRLYTGLKRSVQAFGRLSGEEIQEASKLLTQLLKDYNINVKDQLNKKSGLLTSLLGELRDTYSGQVAVLSLTPFVDQLYLANERVRIAMAVRNQELSTKGIGTLKKARHVVDEAYRSLVKRLNAYILVEETADYDPFANLINSTIVHYKREAIGQKVAAPIEPIAEPHQTIVE
ncbi:MAG: DUF6261 family protein [Mediterranea sp.]|jgi:hypothetical protein|nr:DUF6261 family protein [Mediterranea sp.]